MSPPYRPTYKMVLKADDGNEIQIGNFERLDEASAFAREYMCSHEGMIRLHKYNKATETYAPYEKWNY